MPQADLPSGTVTFLFTDIEGSTRLLQELGDRYADALGEHRAILEAAASARGGRSFGSEGDAVFIAFGDAASAVLAAADGQRALAAHTWPDGRTLRVRMAVHSGEAHIVASGYVGLSLHQVARILAAGHGGQVLVSSATAELTRRLLPPDVELRDLGEHRLKDLAGTERLFQLAGVGFDETFPDLLTLDGRPNNLPRQLTTFVGRDELEDAHLLLAASRLLTLTGPGGTGKTRLALQLAALATVDFPDGVFFVALDAIREPDLIASEIIGALGLTLAGGRPAEAQLNDHLRSRKLLLVLDNFEQVIAGAPLVADLLRVAAGIKVIVTSRIPLRVSGEQEFPVPALAVPPASATDAESVSAYGSVRLFIERATAARPSFRVSDGNASIIADICRRLDGLPLAVELAASRLRILPIEALQARLDQRLALLTSGARDLPTRQQTLRGAIDWSHDLLDQYDRRLFACFAAFAGGAALSAVESVCGGGGGGDGADGRVVIDGLASLVENSLLRSDPEATGEPRFDMLATIGEYAAERLSASDEGHAIRRRHALRFLSMAEDLAGRLTGPEADVLLDLLEADHDNLRGALEWTVALDEPELAMRLVSGLWRFWQIRGHLTEARDRIAQVLAMGDFGDQPDMLRARALGAAGSIAYWRGDNDAAHRHYTQALERARASADANVIADALYDFAFAPETGRQTEVRYEKGRGHLEEALAIYRAADDAAGIAKSTWALSIAAFAEGRIEEGIGYLDEALERYRQLQDRFGVGWSLHMRSIAYIETGRLDEAGRDLSEALRVFRASGDRTGILGILLDFSMLADALGDVPRYWRLRGAAARTGASIGSDLAFIDIPSIDYRMKERPTDDPVVDRLWQAGERMSEEEVIGYALGEPVASTKAAG